MLIFIIFSSSLIFSDQNDPQKADRPSSVGSTPVLMGIKVFL